MNTFPHCDSNILHAPGVCRYCDMYPNMQAKRLTKKINFTGENNPNKEPCPSLEHRTAEQRDAWPGNTPDGYGDWFWDIWQ